MQQADMLHDRFVCTKTPPQKGRTMVALRNWKKLKSVLPILFIHQRPPSLAGWHDFKLANSFMISSLMDQGKVDM